MYNCQKVSEEDFAELQAFAQGNPWAPKWSKDQIERFLAKLTSTSDHVFDLHANNHRACVAALLDRLENKGNHAHLEILGVAPQADAQALLEEACRLAREKLPATRSGFELSLAGTLPFIDDLAKNAALKPCYDTFEMLLTDAASFPAAEDEAIRLSLPADEPRIYQTLREAFHDSLDTSIPPYEEWSASRARGHGAKTWIAAPDGKVVGFVTQVLDEEGTAEIRTLGVLPAARGQGLGRRLLQTAIAAGKSDGIPRFKLTVSTTNRKALDLYRSLGFREVASFRVYCWERAGNLPSQ